MFDRSIRTLFGGFIGLMGLLALALALVSGTVHRDLAFKNNHLMMNEMIRLKSNELIMDLNQSSQDMANALQKSRQFRGALADRNQQALVELLNNQFHQFFVTTGEIKLEQLTVMDTALSIIAEASEGSLLFANNPDSNCSSFFKQLAARNSRQRMAMVSYRCWAGDKALHLVMVPIGGLRLKGYLLAANSLVHSLIPTGPGLGLPLEIRQMDDDLIFQSHDWPTSKAIDDVFSVTYQLDGSDQQPMLKIIIAQDPTPITMALYEARAVIFMVAIFGTLAITLICVAVLRRSTLIPLDKLTENLRLLHRDRKHMGQQLTIEGSREIQQVVRGFNEMSAELGQLYKVLENKAYTDSLTQLPNRDHFQQYLQHAALLYQQEEQSFALFLLDLDCFKQVNDTLGHHIGDLLLQSVSYRLQGVLRAQDLVGRLDQSFIDDLEGEVVARLGGDEFAALFPGLAREDQAISVANKMVEAMDAPFHIEGHELKIGISIGIALCPQHAEHMQTLINNADAAMYQAKREKRGYAVYQQTTD